MYRSQTQGMHYRQYPQQLQGFQSPDCSCGHAICLCPVPGSREEHLEQRAGDRSRGKGRTAGSPHRDDKVSGHSRSNAVRPYPVRGSGIPEEALVGVHVQVAAVAGHLVEGVCVVALLPPQALHGTYMMKGNVLLTPD